MPPPLPRVRAPAAVRLRGALWRWRVVVAAVCLGAAAAATVQALRPPPPRTVPVLVLAADATAGTPLTTSDVTVARVPPDAVPAGALTAPDDAVGAAPVVDLPARQPLTPTLLGGGTPTGPAGTVVAAVRLDDPAVAALLAPGAHVDLVAARPEGGPGETVARRALVLPAPPSDGAGGGLLGGASGAPDVPVLVAVAPDEAVRLAEASASARLVAVVVP
ncbi:flagellar biosynthesis protein FlgA [Cellulomonas shaoxiangyii]|uniref:Flagellar biosynthesis protein FlgA n=1 Tax=Cellulomonas shaoxiangyii TaxID=2566013 RepID=A0A4P7SRN1_9CELL|nr:flagellar biosynthesis protein FlgA [Cellulomonas shaoxiangyii]TGY86107.1 flagellar biosynthesis protein FlgA [Cellulomonas shaoxiangyii]